MAKRNDNHPPEVLDADVLEILAGAHEPVALSDESITRMRTSIMQKIHQEKACQSADFNTVRHGEEGWIEALPGGYVKILQGDINVPNSLLSYLVRLEPGFTMAGHTHPFDEETLMLEGDLTLGDLQLSAGDFHFAAAGASHGKVSTKQGCLAYMRGALPV